MKILKLNNSFVEIKRYNRAAVFFSFNDEDDNENNSASICPKKSYMICPKYELNGCPYFAKKISLSIFSKIIHKIENNSASFFFFFHST